MALALLERALSAADAPDDAISNRILDAALTLVAASGVRNLTMDDVAGRARVGRMTVYRRFGDKQRLVDMLAAREARHLLGILDAAARPDQPIADQVAEGFVVSLRLLREHPVLRRMAEIEPESLLRVLNDDGGAMFTLMRRFVAERLRAAQRAGTAGDIDAERAAEVLVRVMLSLALVRSTSLPVGDEDEARAVARRLLVPIVS